MSEADRVMYVLAIAVFVVGLALLARHAALDMDREGWPGWIFGSLIMIVPPLGMLAWLVFRQAAPPGRRSSP